MSRLGNGRLVSELMRRKVVRVAIGYLVVTWLLLQVAEVTFEPLHLPPWSLTLLVVLAVIGFLVAVVLAWAFEVTPEGLQRDPQDTLRASDSTDRGKKATYRSVAVLPFADMSPAKDQDYFCEGIAEEILSSLSAVKCLHVPSRTSSFRLNDGDQDIRAVGEALGVEAVLEGSVRKDGDKMRITAQLINVGDGYHIWASTYDRNLDDVFEVQREISRSVVRKLCESLNPDEVEFREPVSVADIHAYDYYLQGRAFLNRFTRQGTEFAAKMFSDAVDLDPSFSLAWAGLAQAHTYFYLFYESSARHRNKAWDAAKKAIELAPDSAPCKTARAMTLMIAGRYTEAEVEFRNALAMNPIQFWTTYYYARNSQAQGKLEQAAELFERASEKRPEDYQAPLLALSIYRHLGAQDEACDAALRGTKAAELHLLLHPDNARALCLGSLGLLQLGQTEKARNWIERAIALDPTDGLTQYNCACFYAQVGDADKAFGKLSTASKSGLALRDWMKTDPDLAPLQNDPRFESLTRNGPPVIAA